MKKPTITLLLCILISGCKEKARQPIILNICKGSSLTMEQIDSVISSLPKQDTVIGMTGLSSGGAYRFPSMYERMQNMEVKTRTYKEGKYTVTETTWEEPKHRIIVVQSTFNCSKIK